MGFSRGDFWKKLGKIIGQFGHDLVPNLGLNF